MKQEKDIYNTVIKPGEETLLKDRGSKFYGYAFPVKDEDDVKEALEHLKKKHHTARHFCYAWQMGDTYNTYRVNDDGEPNNSAGMPIYGQLQAFDVTNVLIVVVRFFGGTKLGVGGLIKAYKASAQLALENAIIVKKTINETFRLTFDYPEMNTVMRIIKEKDLHISNQDLGLDCKIEIQVRKKDAKMIYTLIENTYKVAIKKIA